MDNFFQIFVISQSTEIWSNPKYLYPAFRGRSNYRGYGAYEKRPQYACTRWNLKTNGTRGSVLCIVLKLENQ